MNIGITEYSNISIQISLRIFVHIVFVDMNIFRYLFASTKKYPEKCKKPFKKSVKKSVNKKVSAKVFQKEVPEKLAQKVFQKNIACQKKY